MLKQKHHTSLHFLHSFRVVGAGLLVLAFLVSQFHGWPSLTESKTDHVLSYATSVSPSGLLKNTNSERSKDGLKPLVDNSKLNASAQAKADDMVKHNYWSHVSPKGTQPWQYFEKAGYNYQRAGENLAYGFMNNKQTIEAWMHSPTHRANMLGDYRDVGFGIANGADYQGGKFTIVVAHYGLPAKSVAGVASSHQLHPSITIGTATNINYLEQLTTGNLSAILLVSMSLVVGAVLMFAFSHRRMMVLAIESGERFTMRHPMLDICLVVTAVSLIMLSRIGAIS